MIQTLMALWNRGASGRLLVMVVTFFCLCISISLLFVTVGSIWGSLLTHGGRPASEDQRPVSNAVLITATAPPAVTPTLIVVTPTLPPDPCLASPTGARGNTARVDETGNNGRSSVPSSTATPGSVRKTPAPGATVPPTPSPTLPAVSPTAPVTPTVTTQPAVSPTATNTPGNTPTATVTPTITPAPGMSPTPTVALTPTDTSTPGATPTATTTGTSMDTPTVTTTGTTTPVATATASATAGITGRQVRDGRPQVPGTPGDTNNGQQSQGNCLGDALMTGGEASLLSRLQDFIWVIVVSSLLGTFLFCAQMYRLSRRAGRR